MSAPVATVAETFTIVGVPASGSTVSVLPDAFTLVFDGATTVKLAVDEGIQATWNGEDNTANFLAKNPVGNEFTFAFNQRVATPMTGDGTLIVKFPAGMFTVDGVASAAYTYTLIVDANAGGEVGDGTPFDKLVTSSFPEMNAFVDVEDGGDMAFLGYELSQAVTINPACTATIDLLKGSSVQPIAKISANAGATDPMAEVSGNMVSLYFTKGDNPITEDGLYTVSIPEGFFKDAAGNNVGAAKMKYMIGVGTWEPENGSTIDLTVTGGVINSKKQWYLIRMAPMTDIVVNGTQYPEEGDPIPGCTVPATVTDSKGEIVATFKADAAYASVSGGVSKQVMKFSNVIDKNGVYTISIPEGFFALETSNGRVNAPAMTLKYTVVGGSQNREQTYTLSPEKGEYGAFPTVTITYDDVTEIKVPAGATATLNMTNQTNVLTFDLSAEENKLTLTPREKFTKYVTQYTVYTIVLPENTVTLVFNDGASEGNSLLEIKDYKIAPMPDPEITPADGSTMTEFTTITIKTFAAITGYNTLGNIGIWRMVNGVRDTKIGNFSKLVVENKENDNCTITGTFTALSGQEATEGTYEIEIPASLYWITPPGQNRISSKKMVLTYIIGIDSAVKTFEAENALVTVFNVNGVRVLENAEPAALTTLAKGLYIVNGKKVVIR